MSGSSSALRNGSAVFAGCVRDCARHLPAVLANLEMLSRQFRTSAFVLIENDSRDGTKSILQNWGGGRERFHLEIVDGLDARLRPRTVRLAEARNRYLDIIRKSDLRTFDYLFVMDLDDVGTMPLETDSVGRAISFLDSEPAHAGVFANQDGPYYDLWALRHERFCPGDIWLDILDYAETRGVTDEEAFDRVFRPRIFSLPRDAGPIATESAFGGLAIYKMSAVLDASYCGETTTTIKPRSGPELTLKIQACEHVAMNRRIGATGGRLFVLPYLINWTTPHMNYPPSDCRAIVISSVDGEPPDKFACA